MEECPEEKAARGAKAGHPEQEAGAGPAGQDARVEPVAWLAARVAPAGQEAWAAPADRPGQQRALKWPPGRKRAPGWPPGHVGPRELFSSSDDDESGAAE